MCSSLQEAIPKIEKLEGKDLDVFFNDYVLDSFSIGDGKRSNSKKKVKKETMTYEQEVRTEIKPREPTEKQPTYTGKVIDLD